MSYIEVFVVLFIRTLPFLEGSENATKYVCSVELKINMADGVMNNFHKPLSHQTHSTNNTNNIQKKG